MPDIGPMELILLGVVALLLFGPAKLPELGRSLGKGLREFKESVGGGTDVGEVVGAISEVRSAISPSNLAGTFIPGVRDVQDTVTAAKESVTPPTEPPAAPAE
jgi:sec-independent protein translocase protein TatA